MNPRRISGAIIVATLALLSALFVAGAEPLPAAITAGIGLLLGYGLTPSEIKPRKVWVGVAVGLVAGGIAFFGAHASGLLAEIATFVGLVLGYAITPVPEPTLHIFSRDETPPRQ